MLDRRLIVEQTERVMNSLTKRHAGDDAVAAVNRVVEMDALRKSVTTQTDELRAKRNALSKQIGPLMQQGKRDEAEPLKAEVKAFGETLSNLESQMKELEAEQHDLLLVIPPANHCLFVARARQLLIERFRECTTRRVLA